MIFYRERFILTLRNLKRKTVVPFQDIQEIKKIEISLVRRDEHSEWHIRRRLFGWRSRMSKLRKTEIKPGPNSNSEL